MVSEAERMARAGEYVLGRMSLAERERAEFDLETDAEFRLAVITVAERMRRFGGRSDHAKEASDAAWSGIARRLEALPHMRGAKPADSVMIAVPAFLEEDDEEGGFSTVVRAVRTRFGRLVRRLAMRGAGRPRAVAVLHDETHEVAATLEVRSDLALRLLLLRDPGLSEGEQLSLWAMGEDGTYRRLSGFAPKPETLLKGVEGMDRHAGFALVRERLSPMPASHMSGPPFADGLVRPLAPRGEQPRQSARRRDAAVTLKR